MELKDLTLKVKKVISKNRDKTQEVYQGIIMPFWDDRRLDFMDDYICVYTMEGQIISFNINFVTVENTRITDKKIKEKLDNLIEELKEEYKLRLEIVKIRTDYQTKLVKINNKAITKKDKIVKRIEDVLKVQGFISQSKFEENLLSKIHVPFDYSINFRFKGTKILSATLIKEVDLGRYLTNNDYDFIWNEYDNNVMIYHDDIPTSKDYAKIKQKHFKPVNITKLNKFEVFEEFDANGGGDKGSADAYHKIILIFNKGLELKKENIKEVEDCIKELIKKM